MAYPKIKELREQKGWTQQQTSEKLNLPLSTYRSYETGAREPSIEILIMLSELYNVSTDYLLDHQPKPIMLSSVEMKHIQKYSSLDNHGKKIVDIVTDLEFERVSENPTMIKSFRAASSIDNHEPEIVDMEDLSTIPESDIEGI